MKELAIETCGERILFLTGLGSTETAPFALARIWESANSTNMGLPPPGSELKLVPIEGKLEARVRGPQHHARLLAAARTDRARRSTRRASTGSATRFKFADPADPGQGLLFDGRIAEDFKLATGTWVSVGPLRARLVEHFAPYVQDVVIAGADRDDIGMLIFPDVAACRTLAPGLPPDAPPRDVLDHPGVTRRIRARCSTSFAAAGDRQLQPRLPRASCWPSRRRSTPARSPTRARSTSAWC